MGRMLLILVLGILFLALSALTVYLTYQLTTIYFANTTFGLIAAAVVFLIGGFFAFKGMLKS